ncbi:histidine phosphatase family protein [Candidatus Woesearchaeota archaeon]|nr:histidine phosphatase family protein [Candidatus Woesearchaeota archaeon]
MIREYNIRHIRTYENAMKLISGQSDGTMLTGDDYREARRIIERQAKYLAELKYPIDVILHSPQGRTTHTVEIIKEFLPDVPTDSLEYMTEYNWGPYEAQPKTVLGMPTRIYAITQDDPRTENMKHFIDRVNEYHETLFERYKGLSILSVGHGFWFAVRRNLALGQEPSPENTRILHNGQFHIYEWKDNGELMACRFGKMKSKKHSLAETPLPE